MARIGLRGATIAKYNVDANGAVTYGTPISGGCARTADLQLQFAEAELWGCDGLREYLREAVGGNITFEATFFSPEMKVLAFGNKEKTRQITYQNDQGVNVTKTITSVADTSGDNAPYVGFAVYSPDMINHVKKWAAVFVPCVKFSSPNSTMQTRDNNIAFQTPTTTGRFLPDDTDEHVIRDVAILDTEAEAKAWCEACFVQPVGAGG